jgi:hypothetical protein
MRTSRVGLFPRTLRVWLLPRTSRDGLLPRTLSFSAPAEDCAVQSQSHIATDGQSVSKSWCRAPSGAYDQIFITVWQLRSCFLWGALSDDRTGLSFVPCCWSLPAQSFLGPSPLGLATIFYCLRFETSLSVASYEFKNELFFITSVGPNRSYRSPVSVVAETHNDPKIPRIHGNLCWTFIDIRMYLASRCLANKLLLIHCCSGFQAVFAERFPSKW